MKSFKLLIVLFALLFAGNTYATEGVSSNPNGTSIKVNRSEASSSSANTKFVFTKKLNFFQKFFKALGFKVNFKVNKLNTANIPSAPSIPIDGGLSILLLGAAGLGIRKLRKA